MKVQYLTYLALLIPGAGIICAAELPAPVTEAFDSYTALPSVLVPILEKAHDKESATSAAVELRAALPSIFRTRESLHKMPTLTPEQNQLVRTQYGQRMREEWAKMYEQIARVRQANCFKSVELAQAFRLMCMMIEK